MKSNLLILEEGMNALKEKLGLVESEKFISLILKEKFDYTRWQRTLWNNKTIEQIHEEAEVFFNKQKS
jgi:hypothetical protein